MIRTDIFWASCSRGLELAVGCNGCSLGIAHGFEIVPSHFPGWKFCAADTIADSGLHSRLFVGQPKAVARLAGEVIADLKGFAITLSCAGQVRERGTGANVLGSPLAAVAHLIADLARQPDTKPLQAGDLVTTGTLTAAMAVRPSETWITQLNGIAVPGLRLEFVA